MMPIADLVRYYGPLHDDVERCLVGIETGEDAEYWKRSYLRCLCTFVEARVYLIKMELKANNHLIEQPNFPSETLGFLNGAEWHVGNNGEIRARMKMIPPVDELKAIVKILGGFYPNLLWDFSSDRWGRVVDLYRLRNGLTHPKSPKDLSVSDKAIREFEELRADFNNWSSLIYVEAWGRTGNGS